MTEARTAFPFTNEGEITSGPARVIWAEGVGRQPDAWWLRGGWWTTDRAVAQAEADHIAVLMVAGLLPMPAERWE